MTRNEGNPIMWRVVALTLVTLMPAVAPGQRPPLVGTVSPQAVAPPVLQTAPIGGLRTTPLSSGSLPEPGRALRPIPSGTFLPYAVVDAPWPRLGIAMSEPARASAAPSRWMPTHDKPRWEPDTTGPRSALWRNLIVHDAVCDFAGHCLPRTQRVRARWIARCDCYAFADGLGRVWWVEDRRTRR